MVYLAGWIIFGLIVGVLIQYLMGPGKTVYGSNKNIPLIAAVVSINLMSLLDSTSTLFLIDNNFSNELNPVMQALIDHSYFLFIAVKFGLTLIATLVCCYYYERKRRARNILKWTARVYCALMAWHCLLLTSVLL